MSEEKIRILRGLPYLEGLEPEVLARLAAAVTEAEYRAGEIILREGSTGTDVFLIVKGRVEVFKGEGGEEMGLAERGPGDLFGEMGLLEGSPRFASVRALEPTRLLQLSEDGMRSLLAEQPHLLYRTVQVLSARLRESDLHMIADLHDKNRELAQAYRDLQQAQAALVEKERLDRELELARDLQRSILPVEFPQLPGVRCAARSRPARQVGGDFYDVILLSSGCLGLVMADVSDKGMPAALFMALTRSLIRAEAQRLASPRQVLLNVHRLLLEMSRAEIFVTVFYGVLDPERGTLHYARAGHDYPLLYRPEAGRFRSLTATGMPLGLVEEIIVEEAVTDLSPGELVVLYTDGIIHAESAAGEFFGAERLRDTVVAGAALGPQATCDRVFECVDSFQTGAGQFDDMALLVVSVEDSG